MLFRGHSFEGACADLDIEHRLTKPRHPWTNGQVERMNRTIKDATVKRFHYDSHNQLRQHLADFVAAYNFARRLKTLRGLTPYEAICKAWTDEPFRSHSTRTIKFRDQTSSKRNGTLYTCVTSNLPRRVYEHQQGLTPGFTDLFSCKLLVWSEEHPAMPDAIACEKQIKAGSRRKKLQLIEATNPSWSDLTAHLI